MPIALLLPPLALLLLRCGAAQPGPHPHPAAAPPPSAPWSVPLYLWTSEANRDTALLASPPGAPVTNPQSYTLVFSEPVAFASPDQSGADVALTAYWSAERTDIQTSNWDLATLNQHGGNYVALGTVGCVAGPPVPTSTPPPPSPPPPPQ